MPASDWSARKPRRRREGASFPLFHKNCLLCNARASLASASERLAPLLRSVDPQGTDALFFKLPSKYIRRIRAMKRLRGKTRPPSGSGARLLVSLTKKANSQISRWAIRKARFSLRFSNGQDGIRRAPTCDDSSQGSDNFLRLGKKRHLCNEISPSARRGGRVADSIDIVVDC